MGHETAPDSLLGLPLGVDTAGDHKILGLGAFVKAGARRSELGFALQQGVDGHAYFPENAITLSRARVSLGDGVYRR